MDHQTGDLSSQLVLDNRKLIIGFALLILICGIFFVIGFMEGKRQGTKRMADRLPASAPIPNASIASQPPPITGPDSTNARPEKTVREQLDWYQNVNRREEEGVKGLEPGKTAVLDRLSKAEGQATVSGSKPPDSGSTKSGGAAGTAQNNVTYSVQVGAFRLRREAEVKAAMLRVKNYKYILEQSEGSDALFLLKVGKFTSRADAIAVQLKLKRDGFITFIKANK